MTNRVEIEITADNKKALTGFDQVGDKAKGMTGTLGQLFSSGGGGLSSLAGGITSMINPTAMLAGAATGAATALGAMIKNSIDLADEMSKNAQKIGLSTEKLSTLKYAADFAGVEMGTLTTAINKLNMNMLKADEDGGKAEESFKRLGLTVTDAAGGLKTSDEILLEVANKFKDMPDGVHKSAAAIGIFGKSGAELIPLLNSGSDAIKQMQDEAKSLGLEISTETGKRAEVFNDTITKMQKSFEGAAMQLATELLPPMQKLLDEAMPGIIGGVQKATDVTKDLINAGESLWAIADKLGASDFFEFLMWMYSQPASLLADGLSGLAELFGAADEVNAKTEEQINNEKILKDILEQKKKDSEEALRIEKQRADEEQKIAEQREKAAKKLAEEWARTKQSLEKEIAQNTMNEFMYKIYELDIKLSEMKQKFGNKAIINLWYQSEFEKIIGDLDLISEKTIETQNKINAPKTEMIGVDDPAVIRSEEKKKIELANMTEVSNAELAHLALRESMNTDIFSNMAGAAQSFYEQSGQKSKSAFAVYKAMSIAQASIDTFKSANAAFNAMAGIPVIGPYLGAAAAAAAVAFGLSNVSRIASMQPGSSGGGGASSPSIPSVASAGVMQNTNNTTNNTKQLNITVLGHIVDQDKFARELIPSLEKAYSDGSGG